MTKSFNAVYHCNTCHTWQSQETAFGRWIRNNRNLDSAKGYCVTDNDYTVHKFKTNGDRDFQLMMRVEIKTMGADVSREQADTLHIENQLIRNRRNTPTKQNRYQAGNSIQVHSIKNGRLVWVRHYGIHVLRFKGLGPEDSEWIIWDKRQIDEHVLTEILAFNLDPDTLNPIDLRNHHITRDKVIYSLPFETSPLEQEPAP